MNTRSLLLVSLLAGPVGAQTAVDLNTWSAESYPAVSGFGAGVWNVVPDGSLVLQTVNGQPTLFHSDFDAFNTTVEGKLSAAGGDDDFIGFALGFEPGDATNAAADYLLVDWKAGSQSFDFGAPSCTPGTLAPAGLAVSRVTGIPTADEFWGHTNFDDVCSDLSSGLEELQRGFGLGATGWSANQSYKFTFEFSATSLRVFVDDVLELDVAGAFADGRMAFYNFSQASVEYSAFTLACPASFENYGKGWAGSSGVPGLTLDALPIQGNTVNILCGNSAGTFTEACLLFSSSSGAQDIGLGGTVLVATPLTSIHAFHPMAPGGEALPATIPLDPALCGTGVYVQLVVADPGASHGMAFSRGLLIVVGE